MNSGAATHSCRGLRPPGDGVAIGAAAAEAPSTGEAAVVSTRIAANLDSVEMVGGDCDGGEDKGSTGADVAAAAIKAGSACTTKSISEAGAAGLGAAGGSAVATTAGDEEPEMVLSLTGVVVEAPQSVPSMALAVTARSSRSSVPPDSRNDSKSG